MRKILCTVCALVWAMSLFAQTGLEIVNRMNERINDRRSQGISLVVDVKIPVVGTVVTKTTVLGEKRRIDMKVKDHDVITFNDGKTNWVYMTESNSVIITNDTITAKVASSSQGSMDMDMFGDLSGGYDITIKSENLVKWELLCKKKKSNDDDDTPKKITLEVRKESYDPIIMTTKMMGINITMRDFKFGVTEDQVTFNPDNYPGVTIVDQREQ